MAKEILLDVGAVKVGKRVRLDLGDIEELAHSIEAEGLLQPIGVTEDYRLIFGERRLRAFKFLKRDKIPARVVPVSSILAGEYHENEMRKDFVPSERVAIGRAMQALVGNRQGQRTDLRNGKQGALLVAELPQVEAGQKTRDIAAEYARFDSVTIFRNAAVVVDAVAAGKAVPELQEAMDQKIIAITMAAEIATLPKREQRRALADDGAKAGQVLKEARRAEKTQRIMANAPEPLDGSLGQYALIYADPPWRYEFPISDSREIENQYPTMTLDEICALSVNEVCTDDCILFLWTTAPKLAEAMRVITEWGFTYRTGAVWDKQVTGMGHYFRIRHEHLLIATRGEPPTPNESDRPDSVIDVKRGQHSEKPAIVYEMIERMYPKLSKLELFSRNARAGWKAWGFEASAGAAAPAFEE